jgi:FlaA1/EpsC-like NDP-sugar epimerase
MVIALRHGSNFWAGSDALYPSILILASIVRPAIMLLMHAPTRREGRIAQFFSLQLHLVVATLVGSCLMILGSGLLGQRMIGRRDVLLDALIYHLMMTAVVLWQNARLARGTASGKEGSRERILVAGSGIELGMYVGALAALPERHYEIVGVLTPNDRYRTSTIGGHPILGELLDLPQILKTLSVNRLVVAPNGIDKASLAFMQNTAAEMGCQYLAVPLLSGILSRGVTNGVAVPRERAERAERAGSYGLVDGCVPVLRPNVT